MRVEVEWDEAALAKLADLLAARLREVLKPTAPSEGYVSRAQVESFNPSDGQWAPDIVGILKISGWRNGVCSGFCEAWLANDAAMRAMYEPQPSP